MAPAPGYEVLAVRYASSLARKSEAYLNYQLYGEPDAPQPVDYYFWVVRDRQSTTVVDCGFNPEVGRRRDSTVQVLVDPLVALRGLGIEPAAVRRVVVTHAHFDHIGNLAAFSEAEIVVSRREYAFWTGPLARRTQLAFPTEAGELAELVTAAEQGRLHLVDDTALLAPGLELMVVGGHTPGQLIAKAEAPGGTVVLAADALHFYEELERDRPFYAVADVREMYRGFDLLRELTADPRTRLVAGHDTEVGKRLQDRPSYVADALSDLVIRIAGPAESWGPSGADRGADRGVDGGATAR